MTTRVAGTSIWQAKLHCASPEVGNNKVKLCGSPSNWGQSVNRLVASRGSAAASGAIPVSCLNRVLQAVV